MTLDTVLAVLVTVGAGIMTVMMMVLIVLTWRDEARRK